MTTAAEKPKRIGQSFTLTPEHDARLTAEADARLVNKSLLVEKALTMFFADLDKKAQALQDPIVDDV